MAIGEVQLLRIRALVIAAFHSFSSSFLAAFHFVLVARGWKFRFSVTFHQLLALEVAAPAFAFVTAAFVTVSAVGLVLDGRTL